MAPSCGPSQAILLKDKTPPAPAERSPCLSSQGHHKQATPTNTPTDHKRMSETSPAGPGQKIHPTNLMNHELNKQLF